MNRTDSRSQLELLRTDLGRLTAAIGRMVDNQIGGAALNSGSDLRGRVEAGRHWVEEHVKDRPAQSLGIAIGVGFLLGLLTTRRD